MMAGTGLESHNAALGAAVAGPVAAWLYLSAFLTVLVGCVVAFVVWRAWRRGVAV